MKESDIPQVRLGGVFVEHKLKPMFARNFGVAGTRWRATVALDLYDQDQNKTVAEWFYLFACSPEYLQKPTKKVVIDRQNTLMQPEFNLDEIKKEAQLRFKKIHPRSWEEFYSQMSKYFAYEDEKA